MNPYPYQTSAVQRMWQSVRRREDLLLVAPTGSGKTVIAAVFIRQALRRKLRVLFLAHVGTIVDQTYRTVLDLGLVESEVGVIMDADAKVKGHAERIRPDAPVQVCGVQTLARRDIDLAFDIVIIDEAHHAEAPTYKLLLERWPRARVFGLTATPARTDGKGLRDSFDELHIVASPAQLIKAGKLAEPVVYSAPPGSAVLKLRKSRMRGVRSAGKDYVQKQLGAAMNHRTLVGNIIDEWKRLARDRRTVVFASSVQHSLAIKARFVKAGIACEHIDGTTEKNIVDDVLRRLDDGELTVVTNYGVLAEGWHQPCVKCVVLARPTKSLIVYLQQSGRISSLYKNQRPIIIDHAGNAHTHNLPFIERGWSLDGVPKAAGEAPVKVCPNGHVIASGYRACPECGHEFPRAETPEETQERLVKIERSMVEKIVRRLAKRKRLGEGWVQRAMESV